MNPILNDLKPLYNAILSGDAKAAKGDDYKPFIWNAYKEVILKHEPNFRGAAMLERFALYDQARKAFAVVATAETARYANIILKKGIVQTPSNGHTLTHKQ